MPARARCGDKTVVALRPGADSQLHGNKPTCQGKLLVLRGSVSSAPRAFFGPRKKFQRARKRPFAAGAGCSGVSGSGGRPASRSRVGREESPSSATMPATSAPAESPPSCPLSSSSCGSSGGAGCFDAFEDGACLRPCTVACPGPPSGPARPPPSPAATSGVGVSAIPASVGGVGGVSPSLGAAAAAAAERGSPAVAGTAASARPMREVGGEEEGEGPRWRPSAPTTTMPPEVDLPTTISGPLLGGMGPPAPAPSGLSATAASPESAAQPKLSEPSAPGGSSGCRSGGFGGGGGTHLAAASRHVSARVDTQLLPAAHHPAVASAAAGAASASAPPLPAGRGSSLAAPASKRRRSKSRSSRRAYAFLATTSVERRMPVSTGGARGAPATPAFSPAPKAWTTPASYST
mmetsp:Transcript_10230/g.30381  ORF Transcript_10230/g.30381 Transcript_10230/m.30381 type:complete len:406 (+) Transcript_10230:451-1668(+)